MLSRVDKLSVPDAKQLMRDIYETNFEIFNHISGPEKHKRPLAAVAMHFPETPSGVRNVGELIDYYITMDVQKYAGISLDVFLALPRQYLRRVMTAVDKKFTEQMKAAASAMNEAGKTPRM